MENREMPPISEDFVFAASNLDHPHIYDMTARLVAAGGMVRYVHDPLPERAADFVRRFPGAKAVDRLERIFEDRDVRLLADAGVFSERAATGQAALRAGLDFFCDKPLFTTLEQVALARSAVAATGRKWFGYFGERIGSEAAVRAGELVLSGKIGRVVNMIGTGPHRLNPASRPEWFFDPALYGGILTDIGSHQAEQFLHFTGDAEARVECSHTANWRTASHPGFEDFGDVTLVSACGATGYFRVDWLTPDALETWGDGRTFITGTEGFIELRKNTDLGHSPQRDNLFLVTQTESERHCLTGRVGLPFFAALIHDCIHRTETAMPQERVFRASELALQAQAQAKKLS